MTDQQQINKWRAARRRSVFALKVEAGMLLIVCGAAIVSYAYVNVPIWLGVAAAVAGGVLALTLLGDVLNVVYLDRKLKSAVA
jgi:hypothetical protein